MNNYFNATTDVQASMCTSTHACTHTPKPHKTHTGARACAYTQTNTCAQTHTELQDHLSTEVSQFFGV